MVPSRNGLVTLIAAVVLVACGSEADETPGSGTPILFEDDFSDGSLGWLGEGETRFVGENTTQEIVDGVFRITVKTPEGRGGPDTTDLALPGNTAAYSSVENLRIEIDVTAVTTTEDSFYALVCRMQDFDNFYGFALVEGGSASIFKIERGVTTELTEASPGIDIGVTHRVRAECVGEDLALTVDGAPVAEVSDRTFDSGAVGFLAETRGEPGFTVEFDDLVVRTLPS